MDTPRGGFFNVALPDEGPFESVVAEAKLAPPRIRADTVPRPRIIETLDAGRDAALTLVAAPTGFGKTTAVRSWCASRRTPVVWVTLDSSDNDPSRLWTYVATGADRIQYGLGQQALRRLAEMGGSIEVAIDELMNGLARYGHELVVVLDDLHEITETECLASLAFALRRLPPSIRLIAITRVDPPFELAALRARGSLAELRSDELAFEPNEAVDLLVKRFGIDIGDGDIETLRLRVEGWPAALALAAIFLRHEKDPSRAVSEFRGDHRFVAEYLSGVALATLEDDVRDFLLRAAVLGRFTIGLCAHVLGRTDSEAMLEVLERANVLVSRLDHGWFRIHPLLAEFARFQLAEADPGAEPEIHRRAAEWYLTQGLVEEALDHALAGGDHEAAAALLEEHDRPLFWSGRIRTILRIVRALPDSVVAQHPHVAIAAAITTTLIGRGTIERRRYLTMVRRAQERSPERVSLYVSGAAAMLCAFTIEGGVAVAVEQGRRAIEAARAGADEISVSSLGGCALALFFAGELGEAADLATEAINLPEAARRPPGHALARSILSIVESERGQIDRARGHAETAKSLVGGIGSSRSWLGAHAAAALGSVHAAEGDLVQAEQEFAYAEHFFGDEVASVQHTWLLLMLARVRGRRGHLDEAAAALNSAHAALGELGDSGRLPALAAAINREFEEVTSRAAEGELIASPSDAELAVLRLLLTDLTAREIGGKLFISANTVHSHTRSLYRKLGVRTRAEAVARATKMGLLEQSESPM